MVYLRICTFHHFAYADWGTKKGLKIVPPEPRGVFFMSGYIPRKINIGNEHNIKDKDDLKKSLSFINFLSPAHSDL